ncbi:Uncharacterized conserved protein [Helicobacter mustelae]|nr:phosphatidylglycerol lysyltransferase domain-containing protein [Helicobacter mustelae]STP13206.1 Uncharacterized conserved protein [Helicobacter mustelae]
MAGKLCEYKGDVMEFKEVELGDRQEILGYLGQEDFMISDISFANLYLWRKARKIAYAIVSDCLVIQTTYPGENPYYFFPIGAGDKLSSIEALRHHSSHQNQILEFHSLEKHALEFFEKHFSGQFRSTLNRDRSDYVYHIPELIALTGRKYHKKKNHLNRFLQTYPGFVYEPITVQNATEVLEAAQKWFEDEEDPSIGLQNEHRGICDALSHWEGLGIEGGLVRVDGEIIAFSFGERISQRAAVIHIEKANPDYTGAYQIINQQFLANAFCELSYANREEDLGIEGLRKAKMSYNPAFLVDKYEILFER